MHRSEELGLSKTIDIGMTSEWLENIKKDLQPAFDLILKQQLRKESNNPECYNVSWPLGHTPYSSKEDKIKRTNEGTYKEIEFDTHILNCNYFNKGKPDEYVVHGILSKTPQFEIGEHVKKYADAIAEKFNLQDKFRVMIVLYKGPGFCMKWHTDGYTFNRFQLPIVSTPNGQFGWQYTHENNEIEEVWLSMKEGVSYWVNTQNIHIFDNSLPGCTERIHFMVDYLDWEPFYERNNG
jgi:hypothetical protein